MAKSRDLKIQITGSVDQSLKRSFNQVERNADALEGRMKRFSTGVGKGMAVVGAAAAGSAAIGLKKAAQAAIEAEKSQARLVTQLRAAGVSYKQHAGEIDRVIQKTSQLSGLDDEDLQDSFTNIIRVTGDVNKSLRLTGLAADFARAKHMDVAKAGEIVAKVAGGNTGILSRYGITIKDGATATEALGALQQKFAGQAEAYGKTTAGSLDRASVASENLGETVGAKLTPLLAKAANALVNVVEAVEKHWPKIKRAVNDVVEPVRNALGAAGRAVRRFAQTNREEIADVIRAARRVGRFFRDVFEDVIVPVVRRAVRNLKPILQGIVQALGAVIRLVSSVINGDWRKAWRAFRDIVRGIGKSVVSIIKGAGSAIWDAVVGLGSLIVRGIVKGIKALPGAVKNAVVGGLKAGLKGAADLVPKLRFGPIGDGIGKAMPSLLPSGGAVGGLKGANAALGPIAGVGGRYGLTVSSGARPGSITSSGNTSYHSSGEAIDLAGSPAGMLATFRYLKNTMGSRLAELIYTPGGVGINNGRPHRYSGQVAADHHDHVHVALDLGRPGVGIGDGLGKLGARAAAIGDGYGHGRLMNLWTRAGGSPRAANMAAAIALAESGGNSRAMNTSNSDGSIDRGLWQINSIHGGLSTLAPLANARSAVKISSNGRNWNPWVVFQTGAYRRFLRRNARPERKRSRPQPRGGRGGGGGGGGGGDFSFTRPGKVNGVSPWLGTPSNQDAWAALQTQTYGPPPGALDDDGTSAEAEEAERRHQEVIAAQEAAAEAAMELAEQQRMAREAMESLRDEIRTQNNIAGSTMGIQVREISRALADLLSGEIVGHGMVPRSALPASGSVASY